ncbi:hypothetical protein [Nocardia terpenica]|uniref:Holin n=1 Tax=Nocardia terpenica TaxID=455432 RepID=A0A161XC37_9NOCA|nr:hypothetical protein [Nocardia terpenica]KZM70748.1 hypothetical protein AWN90_40015 [Nocardia terpenica]NQE89986.1 hypothetical protein [Nocardia terpenica]
MTSPRQTPAAPSQVRHPWHAVARTVFQLAIGIAAAMPIIVSASGIPATAAGTGAALAISAAITRIMAIPAVDAALRLWLPWLAAEPATHAGATLEPNTDSGPAQVGLSE